MSEVYKWLAREGYEQVTSPLFGDAVLIHPEWSRLSKYGTVKCKENGKISVRVQEFPDGTYAMRVEGKTEHNWVGINATEVSAERLVSHGRQLEHRLVDAWREMAS